MTEYDLHTVSGKAKLAALLLILLSLLAFVIGGLTLTGAVSPNRDLGDIVVAIFQGGLWIAAGIVGLIISGRIRDGDHVMWLVGIIVGIVVMVSTWRGFFWVNPNKGTFGFFSDVLDAVAFLLALGMTLLLLLALLDRDKNRVRTRR